MNDYLEWIVTIRDCGEHDSAIAVEIELGRFRCYLYSIADIADTLIGAWAREHGREPSSIVIESAYKAVVEAGK